MLQQITTTKALQKQNLERNHAPSLDTGFFANSILEKVIGGSASHHTPPGSGIGFQGSLGKLQHQLVIAGVTEEEAVSRCEKWRVQLLSASANFTFEAAKGYSLPFIPLGIAFGAAVVNPQIQLYPVVAATSLFAVIYPFFRLKLNERATAATNAADMFQKELKELIDPLVVNDKKQKETVYNELSETVGQLRDRYVSNEKKMVIAGTVTAFVKVAAGVALFATLPLDKLGSLAMFWFTNIFTRDRYLATVGRVLDQGSTKLFNERNLNN